MTTTTRFLGAGDAASMAALVRTLSALSLALGTCVSLLLLCVRRALESFFTSDPGAHVLLRTVWPLLCALQPINATVGGWQIARTPPTPPTPATFSASTPILPLTLTLTSRTK